MNNDKKILTFWILIIAIFMILILTGCEEESIEPKSKMVAFSITEINAQKFAAVVEYDGKTKRFEKHGIASGKDLFPGQSYQVVITESNYDRFLIIISEDGVERERREIEVGQLIKILWE